jgi:hypothetical protein
MAEEKMEHRPANLHQFFPWFELFRAFQVALDPKKLVLAAAGILVMAFWWWICSVVFYAAGGTKPQWTEFKNNEQKPAEQNWADFQAARRRWNLRHETAGNMPDRKDAGDLADNPDQYEILNRLLTEKPKLLSEVPESERQIIINNTEALSGKEKPRYTVQRRVINGNEAFAINGEGFDPGKEYVVREKPYGRIRTWPFFEDRGPNPYLLVFGRANVPREEGVFHWFVFNQVPVLVEPVVKFVLPIYYLLHTDIGVLNFLYFAVVLLGTLAVWALFGGAITRMAAVQIARREKIGLTEAMRFTLSKWGAFFSAPLFPLLGVVIIALLLILYGFFHLIPVVGDIIVDGLGWPLALLLGLVMAVILVGLVSWPMMYATISAEGSDSFDALSRSYSYVIQSPWHYLWYVLVSLAYGAVVVFFVGFMGSLAVYLAKWGVSENPFTGMTKRDPSYLFVYAPTSWEWRTLLMQGGDKVNPDGTLQPEYFGDWKWYNYAGAFMVSVIWVNLAFLLILGFAYSFFWSAGTITYLLMRRHVDDTDMDEVYLDEEEAEEAYTVPPPAPAAAAPAGPNLTMVEPPTLKTTTGTASPPPPTSSTAVAPPRVEPSGPPGGDGNPPPPA